MEPADQGLTAAPGDAAARALRATGLVLVLVVALALPLVWGLQAVFGPPRTEVSSVHDEPLLRSLFEMTRAAGLLALTGYVLWRQGRGFRSLHRPGSRDLLWGSALAVVGLLPYAAAGLVMDGALPPWLAGPPTLERLGVRWLAANALGIVLSCLVFRAYLIEELVALTGNVPLAIVASVGGEALSEFRFDLPALASFLLYALFFLKTRRVAPIVVAMALVSLWVGLHHAAGR